MSACLEVPVENCFCDILFEAIRVFPAMRLWLVLLHQHKSGIVDSSFSLVCSFLVVSQLYIHLFPCTITDA